MINNITIIQKKGRKFLDTFLDQNILWVPYVDMICYKISESIG